MPPPPERKAAAAPLRRVRARLDFDLHPSTAGDVLEGMQQELHGMLNRYSHQFGGVVMGFSQEKVLGHQARIHPYFPYLSVKATALLTLFSPQPGDILEGTVNQVGHDYIGLLVLEVLNASITAEHIRKEFRHQGDCWSSSKGGGWRITVGTKVRFAVKETHGQDDFFSISGSLLEAGTGVLGDEEGAGKKKRSGGKREADGEAGEEAGKKRRKSKEGKASKARAAEGDEAGEAAGERKSGEKKKGKKDKKAKKGDNSKGEAERAEKKSAKPSAESKKKEKKTKKAEKEAAKAGGKGTTEGEAEKGGGGDAPLKSEEKAGKARKPTKDKKARPEKSEAKEEKKSDKANAKGAKRRLDADGVVAAEPAKKRKKDKH
eukprot:jgi/Tetstr1/430445/TSEL_020255.t1